MNFTLTNARTWLSHFSDQLLKCYNLTLLQYMYCKYYFYSMMSANLEMMSANLEMMSANLEMMSANLEMMSANLEMMSANLEMMSANLEMVSANLEMISAVLKFLNSLARASAVLPSLSSSRGSAPLCQ